MSTTIDQRVVSLQFDNKQFERNTATTMSTLDKLKEKLTFNKASKGLENVGRATKNVRLDGLSSGVQTVTAKFSAMQVMAVTALANITNSAVNAGRRIAHSLTIAPVGDGFREYEMMLNAIQTTMAGTGKTAKEVQDELKKLDDYADKTVYSTADMLNNLPKFTNAGVKLEDATKAMIGIANATALAGGDASKASIAFYNLGQAIGTGYLTRMDYNSINNAGIATMEWKEQMVEAAIAAGTLTKNANGTYKAGKKNLTLQQLFIDGLQEQWATTDVMLKVFGDYGDEQTKIGKKAYAAAQDIKTFTMMMDSLKATAGTGWKDTWQLIFGDLDEAKEFWTGLTNAISGVITRMADWRNRILQVALDFSTPWKAVTENIGKVSDVVSNVTGTLEYFQDVVDKVWLGKFNNWGDNPDRRDLLKKAGYDPKVVQYLVNLGEKAHKAGKTYKLTAEDVQKAHKKYGLEVKTTTEDVAAAFENLTDAQLEAAGLTEDEISLFRALAKESKKTGRSISDLAKEMSEIDGRALLIDSFKNLGNVILDAVRLAKDALTEVFEIPTVAEMGVKLYNAIKAFNKFTESIRLVNKETGELTESGQNFMSIFKGIFAVIDMVLTVIKGPAKLALIVLKSLLKVFGVNILDILADAGEKIAEFGDGFNNVVDAITKFVTDNVDKWIEKFKETEIFKTVAGWFTDAADKMSGAFETVSGKLDGFKTSTLVTGFSKVYDFVSGIADSLRKNKIVITIIDAIRTAFDKLKSFFTGFKLPEFNLDNLRTFFTDFITLGNNIKSSGQNGVAGVLSGVGSTLKTKFVTPKVTKIQTNLENFFADFVSFWLKVGSKIKDAFEIAKDVAKSIVKFLFGTEEINLPVIMDAVQKFLWIITLYKAIQALDTIASPFSNVTDAINNFANSLKWDAIAKTFKSMALALGVLTVCILVIASIDDMNKAWQAAGMLAGLLIVMGGVIAALGGLSNKLGGLDIKGVFGVALSMMLLVGAIALLVHTLKEIDGFRLEDPVKTWSTLAGTLLALTVGVRMVAKAGKADFKSIAAILTLVGALKLILDVITAYDEFDWSGKSGAIKKMMEMMLAISIATNVASRGLKAGSNAKGMAFMILAMVLALKLLLGSIEDFAAMSNEDLHKGGAVVTTLLGIMTFIAFALGKASGGTVLEKGQKSINHFTGLAVALLAVVAAIWLLGKMDPDTLKQGGYAVGQVLILFTAMLFALGKSCSGLKIGPIIAFLVAFGLLTAELAYIMKWLDAVPWQSKISTAMALSGVLLAMSGALRTLTNKSVKAKDIYKWIGALAVLGLIVGGLAVILRFIKDINPANAIGNSLALGGLLAAMAGVLHVLSGLDMRKLSPNKMKKLGLIFAGMTVILAMLGAVLWGMSSLGVTNAIPNTIALSVLISVLSGVLTVLSLLKVNKNAYLAVGAIALLGLVVLELGWVLSVVKAMDISGMESQMLIVAGLLAVLTVVMAACAGLGIALAATGMMGGVGMAIAIAGIAALGLVIWELGAILKSIKTMDISGMESEVQMLSQLLYKLIPVLAACSILGLAAPAGIAGIVALGVLGLVIWELGAVLNSIKGMDIAGMEPVVDILTALLYDLVPVLAVCTVLGFAAPAAIAGIGTLITMVGALGGLVLAVGAIMSIPGLDKFLDTGITMLEKLANGIGSIISSFGEGLTSKLPAIGDNLSKFGDSLGGFVTSMKSVDSSITENASTLVNAISTLTTSDFVNGLNNLFRKKDEASSLEVLGTELSGFAENAKDFITSMGGMSPETSTSIDSFCGAISSLNNICGDNNFGDGALTSLGTTMEDFAGSMKNVAESLSNLTDDDVANIQRAATAAEALADLNACIPKEGGLWQNIAGSQDLASWGTKISAFADSLIAYSIKVSGKSIDSDAIKKSTEAATAISDLNASIPKEGELWQTIAGSQDLSNWGAKISAFAESLVSYSSKVSGQNIDKEAIIRSCEAATELAKLNDAIPESDGIWQWLAGEKSLDNFGTGLVTLADGIVHYATKATEIDDTKIAAIGKTGEAVTKLKEVCELLPSDGGKWGQLWGNKDPASFGAGIGSLASGISQYCAVAGIIDQSDIDAINFTKNAINALETVVSEIGDIDLTKTSNIKTAGIDLKGFCQSINSITTGNYDYSGLTSVKTAITTLNELVTGINTNAFKTNFANLAVASTSVSSMASRIASLNDKTYGGVAVLDKAVDDLAKVDVDGAINAFAGKAGSLKTAISNVVSAMTDAFGGDLSKTRMSNAMISLIESGIKAVETKLDAAKTSGSDLASSLASGIKSKDSVTAVTSAGESAGNGAATGVSKSTKGMFTAGIHLGMGLAAGIRSMTLAAYSAGYALGKAAVQGEKDGQKSNSPSKLTIQAGKWLGEGLIIGMDKMNDKVYGAGSDLGKAATGSLSKSIARISDVINSDIDAQPTIRPIMDLSDVRAGASAIGNLLNTESSVGVVANAGRIGGMMNRYSQNRGNDDVVAAIDKLNKRMDNLGNTTNIVNGITYDDGSNINNAVATLVRAAKIERRV